MSSDAWYTLIYLPPRPRRELHARRRRIWTGPLVRGGMARHDADALYDRMEAWKSRGEARGRTPRLFEQAAWLSERARVRLDASTLVPELDRALLAAPIRPSFGAERTLRVLSDRGVRLAVISNVVNESGDAARTVLDRAGLLPHFRVVYLSCDHPWAKPRPEPFRRVASFLGVPVSSLTHVGDLTYDLLGARRAGAGSVLFVAYARWNAYLAGAPDLRGRAPTRSVASWAELGARWEELLRPARRSAARTVRRRPSPSG